MPVRDRHHSRLVQNSYSCRQYAGVLPTTFPLALTDGFTRADERLHVRSLPQEVITDTNPTVALLSNPTLLYIKIHRRLRASQP